MNRSASLALLAGVLVLGAVGCGAVPPDEGDPDSFIALTRDFQDFQSWPSVTIDGEASGTIHTAGKRTVYYNKTAEPGATEFPVGTIIVKTMATGEIFARAKRGPNYNVRGAVGWEWFELKTAATGTYGIAWQGITPPLGACYGGIVGGACNDCHKAAAMNDFVFSQVLQLQPAP